MTDTIVASHILSFGKYKGKDINNILKEDECYCNWLLKHKESSNLNEEQIKILESKLNINDVYIGFGKYKNKTIEWIFNNDKKYIYYLKNNEYIKKNKTDIIESINKLESK